jgi:hypothetical protein
MADLGQTRPSADVASMSGLPSETAVEPTSMDGREVPATYAVQQNASLFDHLVRELLDRQRHLKAKRLGGLQIDDKFEFG